MPNRRDFLRSSMVSVIGLPLGALGSLGEQDTQNSWFAFDTFNLEIVRTDLNIPNLPEDFEDYRIAFVSDLHLGVSVPTDFMRQVFAYIETEKVDLLLLGGDYLWVPDQPKGKVFATVRNEELGKLSDDAIVPRIYSLISEFVKTTPAKDGAYAVMGNHDNWISPQACQKILPTSGAQFIDNQLRSIQRGDAILSLIGLDDYWTGIPRMPRQLPARKQSNEVRVLMAHNPDTLGALLDQGSIDLDVCLCGHTHGGQIALPLIGAPKYNIRDLRFRSGLFEHENPTLVYTTRGIGFVEIPLRLNCRPEVSILSLKRK